MNDDLISRQAAIGAVNTALFPKINTAKDAEKALKQLPSAERHGRWDNTRPDAPMFGFYYCSICGRKRTSPQDHYCPNCGARMDLDEVE